MSRTDSNRSYASSWGGCEVRTTIGELVQDGLLVIGDGYRAKLAELGGDGPLFLRAGALSSSGFNFSGLDAFSATESEHLDRKMGQEFDVVITTKGNSLGRSGLVPKRSPSFVYSPHLSYWRSLARNIVDPRYLYYWTRAEDFRSQLRGTAFATDMAPYLSLRDQAGLVVTLPPPAEQRAIAGVLGALDDKIAANERVVATAEAWMVAAVGLVLPQSSVGRLARHVTTPVRVRDFHDVVAQFSLPAFDESARPQVGAGSGIKSNKTLVDRPMVLVSKLNPRIPRIWDIPVRPFHLGVASTEFVALEPLAVTTSALWAALRQPHVSSALAGLVSGTSGSHQRVKPVEVLSVSVPDVRTLSSEMASALASAGRLVHQTREENVVLARTRDTLLPLLMSGKLRVKDIDTANLP